MIFNKLRVNIFRTIKVVIKNWFEIILVALILLGLSISFFDLIQNKSLWLDEAYLALNIVSKSYLDLLTPLDDGQVAPIGFLFIEKLLFNIFGSHEWVLRFFPFFSFILSIFFFFFLNKRLFKSIQIALFSCALFSLNFELINYATEVKQYAIDVLAGILIVLASLKVNNNNVLSIFTYTFIGAIAIWFSNVAVIILVAVAIYNIYHKLFNTDKKEWSVFIPILIWAASFMVYYIFFIYNHPHTNNMANYWKVHFLPNDIFSLEFYIFIHDKARMIFANLLNTNDQWFVALFFYFFGAALILIRKKIDYFLILFLPIIIHLGLSSLHLYPFEGRFLLYQIPFIIIPISYVAMLASSHFKKYHVSKIIICLLLIYTYNLMQSPRIDEEEIKKSLAYVNTHINSTDNIYVYYSSVPAFKFYKDKYHNIKKDNTIYFGSFSRADRGKYISEINSISDDIWLIFSHMHTEGFPDKPPETEEQFILDNLINNNYIVLLEAKFKDSSCYKICKLN